MKMSLIDLNCLLNFYKIFKIILCGLSNLNETIIKYYDFMAKAYRAEIKF